MTTLKFRHLCKKRIIADNSYIIYKITICGEANQNEEVCICVFDHKLYL
jgi:hypothetical protein